MRACPITEPVKWGCCKHHLTDFEDFILVFTEAWEASAEEDDQNIDSPAYVRRWKTAVRPWSTFELLLLYISRRNNKAEVACILQIAVFAYLIRKMQTCVSLFCSGSLFKSQLCHLIEVVFQEKFNEGVLEVEAGRELLARTQVFTPAAFILIFTSWPNTSSLPGHALRKLVSKWAKRKVDSAESLLWQLWITQFLSHLSSSCPH